MNSLIDDIKVKDGDCISRRRITMTTIAILSDTHGLLMTIDKSSFQIEKITI